MTGLEVLQSVQYVEVKGQRFAVINVNDWEALIEWLQGPRSPQTDGVSIRRKSGVSGEGYRGGL